MSINPSVQVSNSDRFESEQKTKSYSSRFTQNLTNPMSLWLKFVT
jgi:hypothetical protein